ncbi:FAD-binding-3 domain-containing protein [Mycena kentingensis (nom. inval.)]|nr:FAD-binding-3 domain-containing protein [Mycena kentingensis (nom. inval.)]
MSSRSNQLKAPPLKFIIIGGSVSGLAAAIGLKESGHHVVVLEKDAELGGAGQGIDGCARLPPNGTKILTDWGLAGAAEGKTATIGGWWLYKYYTPGGALDKLGVQRSWPEMVEAARGDYMMFRHTTLLRILYDKLDPLPSGARPAKKGAGAGDAVVHFGAEVVQIDTNAATVTLASGEVFSGDAIIGADGRHGFVRRLLIEEEEEDAEEEETGLALCAAIVPKKRIQEAGLADLFYDDVNCGFWMGNGRTAFTYPVGGEEDVSLWVYTPDNPQRSSKDTAWKELSELRMDEIMGGEEQCDPRLLKLASLAGPTTVHQLTTPYQLDSWVSESGRVLAIGAAAHPAPVSGLYLYTTALEDGLFIGKVFSHTRDPARITEFFHAFQEAREPRCTRLRNMDQEYIDILSVVDGEIQEGRDATIRANDAAGRNGMEGDLQQMMDDFVFAYGYDADDDADEWWINWGRMRQHGGSNGGGGGADFAAIRKRNGKFAPSRARRDS